MFVRDVLRNKASGVWTVGPETTIYSALELMAEKNVGALPVMKGDDVVGMFSERDHARKVTLLGKSARATTVGELMSQPVICVEPDTTIEHCMSLMTDHRVRHLPVMEEGQLVGLISSGDVLKATIDKQLVLIRDLENFIAGHRS